jgi:FSR family fosmidomycin resistance protein-like MFS transporter
MTASQIGLAISAYQFFNALSQPFFGWLTDKVGSRWLGPGSVLWTAACYGLAFFFAQTSHNFYIFFLFLSLAACGVGAFHPMGAMHAATISLERATTSTGIFFLFGQMGLAAGPLLVGFLLDHLGNWGIYSLTLAAIPLFILMIYALAPYSATHLATRHAPTANALLSPVKSIDWYALTILAIVIAFRSWAFLGTIAFLPKLYQQMGWQATAYGAITSAYWLASAITGVIGGHWADRIGPRPVIFSTMLLGSIPLYFLPLYDNNFAFIFAILVGGLLGASHSIIVVTAQALLPGSKSFASGLSLGYVFGTGALASWLIGQLADQLGTAQLGWVIQMGAGMGLIAALAVLFLPTKPPQAVLSPA